MIALHCSGASGRQWRPLAQLLGEEFEVIAPDLPGWVALPCRSHEDRFSLSDEGARVRELIDAAAGPVHLVGHSYGGGVALRAAVDRPTRIASLTLYEPSAFHVLKTMGPDGRAALAEIRDIAGAVRCAVRDGDPVRAARCFVDYWNGSGAWDALRPEHQADLVRYIPKACLEFGALIDERMPLAAYRRIRGRVLLLQGEHVLGPSAAILRKLTSVIKPAAVATIAGAGHMGPLSHADAVAGAIADHIRASEFRLGAMRRPAAVRKVA